MDIDKTVLGVCVVCSQKSTKGLCRTCRTDPERRALWQDPATGELLPWYREYRKIRNRHAQRYKRNKDRVRAGQTAYQRTGKRGRPKAVGILE